MRSRSTGSPRRKWRMARVASRAQQVLFSRARADRASGGTLNGCREGSVKLSGGGAGPRIRLLDVLFVNK